MVQIIPKIAVGVESNWQKELSECITDPTELLEILQLAPADAFEHIAAKRLFPVRVPRFFVSLMEKGNWHDPLLRQVMPLSDEFIEQDGFVVDPLQEHDTAGQGLLHKYQSRVLLIVRGGCAVNCRYCFRRHFPYQDNTLNKRQLQETFDYLRAHPEVNEVILSGGDPLMANDEHLKWLHQQLLTIPNIKRLRIHTRLPVVMPNRIDNAFLHWVAESPLQVVMVLHINHANEVSPELRSKITQLTNKGVRVFNQGVLLAGINDTVSALMALNETLFDAFIQPYYLFLLDKVKGASHFDVSDQRARELMTEVIKRQPGFMIPKLVREIGNQPGKTPIDLQLHP